MRGLGSGRQGARQGFALALAALLGARPDLSPASVLALMNQHLPFSKSMQARCRHACPSVCRLALQHLGGISSLNWCHILGDVFPPQKPASCRTGRSTVCHAIHTVPSSTCCAANDASSVSCGSEQGSDARDSLLGRLFGCAAVIRSGRVADAAVAAGITARLLAVAAAKSFLREAATAVLLELLEGAPDAVTAAVLADSAELRGVLQAPPTESNPEVWGHNSGGTQQLRYS